MILEGVYSVLPTPFDSKGDLDLTSLRRVIDLFIGAGVSGLTALGVTSEHRLAVLPNVPTLVEQGYQALIGSTFTAMMAPANTPADVLANLHRALVKAAQDPKFREDIERLGAEVTVMTPRDTKTFLERESAVWIPIVRKLNATQD